MCEDIISCFPEARIIFDPFMGSGTTGVAALSAGRHFLGIELDDTYFQSARKRLFEARSKWLDGLLGGVE
jgi:DNA modification methylase